MHPPVARHGVWRSRTAAPRGRATLSCPSATTWATQTQSSSSSIQQKAPREREPIHAAVTSAARAPCAHRRTPSLACCRGRRKSLHRWTRRRRNAGRLRSSHWCPRSSASGDVSIALLEKDYEVSSFGTVKRLKLLDDVFVQACQRARAAAPRKKEEKESGRLEPLPEAYKEYDGAAQLRR